MLNIVCRHPIKDMAMQTFADICAIVLRRPLLFGISSYIILSTQCVVAMLWSVVQFSRDRHMISANVNKTDGMHAFGDACMCQMLLRQQCCGNNILHLIVI